MGRVLTNATGLLVALEEPGSPGTLPATPLWHRLEPNDIEELGADITKVSRDPISQARQRRKGVTTDLDSTVQYAADVTLEEFVFFAPGFVFATYNGPVGGALYAGADRNTLAADDDPPPAGTDSGYTHDALGSAIPAGRLVFARGFSNAVNNGITDVIAGSTTTATLVSKTLVDETPAQTTNASLEVCGVRGAAGDLEIDASGNLISTSLDFTTLGLTVGQFIHIGGSLAANQFFESVNYGLARVTAIATNEITLDKKDQAFTADDGTVDNAGGAGKQIDILFGRFLRNVDVNDGDFLEASYQFEASFPNLGTGGATEYEYPNGNYANEMAINGPLTDKITVTFGFIGLDTPEPTATQATGADAPIEPVQTEAFNTSTDELRLRVTQVDETGLTSCFKDWTLTIRNNVSPEKCQGTLGATFMNYGNIEVDLEADALFTNSGVIAAIRNNETVTMEVAVRNGDGGFVVDIPSMTLGGGGKDYPRNESVRVNFTGEAFEDPVLGTSVGISLFPVLPPVPTS